MPSLQGQKALADTELRHLTLVTQVVTVKSAKLE
jgi:hypothetical protein